MNGNEPTSASEWQEAVDLADVLLRVDSAEQYGLILVTGTQIDVERCERILDAGKRLGYMPRPDAITRFFQGGAA
jgi:predicted ABC-type transport system involved in lysophospholipase L1 biosynthesis ATPase subunit